MEMLRQQNSVFAEDFADEHSDRERIEVEREEQEERIAVIEEQNMSLREEVKVFSCAEQLSAQAHFLEISFRLSCVVRNSVQLLLQVKMTSTPRTYLLYNNIPENIFIPYRNRTSPKTIFQNFKSQLFMDNKQFSCAIELLYIQKCVSRDINLKFGNQYYF
jgi:hypothetical protein